MNLFNLRKLDNLRIISALVLLMVFEQGIAIPINNKAHADVKSVNASTDDYLVTPIDKIDWTKEKFICDLKDHFQFVRRSSDNSIICVPCVTCPAGEHVNYTCHQQDVISVPDDKMHTFQRCVPCPEGKYKPNAGPLFCKPCRNECGNMNETQKCTRVQNRDCDPSQCKPGFYGTDCDYACCHCGNATDGYTEEKEEQCLKHAHILRGKVCKQHADVIHGQCHELTTTTAAPITVDVKDRIKKISNDVDDQNKTIGIICGILAMFILLVLVALLKFQRARKKKKRQNGDLEDCPPRKDFEVSEDVRECVRFNCRAIITVGLPLYEYMDTKPLLVNDFCRIADQREGSVKRIADYYEIDPLDYGKHEMMKRQKTECGVLVDLFQQRSEINVNEFFQVLYKLGLDDLVELICKDLHPTPDGEDEVSTASTVSSAIPSTLHGRQEVRALVAQVEAIELIEMNADHREEDDSEDENTPLLASPPEVASADAPESVVEMIEQDDEEERSSNADETTPLLEKDAASVFPTDKNNNNVEEKEVNEEEGTNENETISAAPVSPIGMLVVNDDEEEDEDYDDNDVFVKEEDTPDNLQEEMPTSRKPQFGRSVSVQTPAAPPQALPLQRRRRTVSDSSPDLEADTRPGRKPRRHRATSECSATTDPQMDQLWKARKQLPASRQEREMASLRESFQEIGRSVCAEIEALGDEL